MEFKTMPTKGQTAKIVAPNQQLLITEHNISEIVNKIYVKKKDIPNPDVIAALKHLVKVNDTKDPERQLLIFLMQKDILEHASEIFIEHNEDILFEETNDQLNIILELIKDFTVKR